MIIKCLTFSGINYTRRQTPLTLESLLYKNGLSCRAADFSDLRSKGEFGEARVSRLPLVSLIYDELNSFVISGKSFLTMKNIFEAFKDLYKYGDSIDRDITVDNVREIYQAWVKCEYGAVFGEGKERGIYGRLSSVARVLGNATGLGRDYFIVGSVLKPPKKSEKGFAKVDRQNLEVTKEFVSDLLSIRNSIDESAFIDELPITVSFVDGAVAKLYGGLTQYEKLLPEKLKSQGMNVRYSLFNLRVECELLIFMSQTSMNLTDAASMKAADYRFETKGEKCEVREYKNRKHGEVIFTAYSEYKPYFIEFLQFRKSLGIDKYTDKLFGKVPQPGSLPSTNPHPRSLTLFMKKNGREMLATGVLRNTRQNWLARRSGDPELAADMGQHDLATFHRYYDRPHHQTAAAQWTVFFKDNAVERQSAMEGRCNGLPKSLPDRPPSIDSPNCVNPQLCMFCVNYKGVESYSYIWSLLTYKRLKEMERRKLLLSKSDVSGYVSILERIDQIVSAFELIDDRCLNWAEKAKQQIKKQNFHKRWAGYIQMIEVVLL